MPSLSEPVSLLEQLAELLARHKLVPFIGAGCSAPHLGIDWDGLTAEMATQAGLPHGWKRWKLPQLKVAQKFVDAAGRKALTDLLVSRLGVQEFDDGRGETTLSLLSTGIGVVYTTNQDNVIDLCCEKYGWRFRRVVSLQDLADYRPGERLLVMFHGAIDIPDSIVFTWDDYRKRMSGDCHPLDIRLRADLLAKSFLFVGYSFRDPNIQALFKQLKAVFGGKLPRSYLIAYDHSSEMECFARHYGVTVIDPMSYAGEGVDPAEAFGKFVSDLCRETIVRKTRDDLADLFKPKVPQGRRVLVGCQLEAIEEAARTRSFDDACPLFRGFVDDSLLPSQYQQRVVACLVELARSCSTAQQASGVRGAFFNLQIDPSVMLMVEAFAATITIANLVDHPMQAASAHPVSQHPARNEAFRWLEPIAIARAIELLDDWGRSVAEPFRYALVCWLRRNPMRDDLPDTVKAYVRHWIDKAWEGSRTVLDHPLGRPRGAAGAVRGYSDFHQELGEMISKEIGKPYED
jgi:hypothetical protein